MTERDDTAEQAHTDPVQQQTQNETTVSETTTEQHAVGETPTDPAEEKRVQPAEALEEQRTETVTETTETTEAPSSDE